MLIVTILTALYYNMVIAWTVFYLFASFTSDLPWRTCSGDWAGENCYSPDEAKACWESSNGTQTFFNKTCVDIETLCSSNYNRCADPAYKGCSKKLMNYHNNTHCLNTTSELHGEPEYLFVKINRAVDYVLPAEEYFQNYMLRRSDSMEDYGTLQWPLVLCLLFAWFMVGGSLIKGVKSSGKVVYFTALFPYVVLVALLIKGEKPLPCSSSLLLIKDEKPFPYVVLVALLIKGAPLDGAFDGIVFYIQPKWGTLLEPEVWVTATTQIFYSLSPAFGGLLTLSSYNRFDNNCQRDAILVAISNCATSVFAGFVIFSIVGHMAFLLDKPVGEVIQSGPGLAFIAYPQQSFQLSVLVLTVVLSSPSSCPDCSPCSKNAGGTGSSAPVEHTITGPPTPPPPASQTMPMSLQLTRCCFLISRNRPPSPHFPYLSSSLMASKSAGGTGSSAPIEHTITGPPPASQTMPMSLQLTRCCFLISRNRPPSPHFPYLSSSLMAPSIPPLVPAFPPSAPARNALPPQ
ncbi:unnamed protein product [Cyprideis torosa]|uniref:Uncharacterized protein n=1 Tax=Cyprideis torosa TaxID=163714 RepID=A0A7R8WL38_9CRUS|nr:unnamed protein product [Cyprideis torosa]CAG0897646.1 unnamed protein product [Cyprideis torosa]